jgi:hypothetical protein
MPAFSKKIWITGCCPSSCLKIEVLLTIATTLARGRAKNILKTGAHFLSATRHNEEFVK